MQVPPCLLAPFHQWSPALRVPRQKAPHLPLQSQQTKVQADVPKVSHLLVVTVNVCLVCELLSLKVNANSLLQGKLKQALSLPLDLLFPPAPLIPSSSQDPLRWTRRGASVSHQNPVGQHFVDLVLLVVFGTWWSTSLISIFVVMQARSGCPKRPAEGLRSLWTWIREAKEASTELVSSGLGQGGINHVFLPQLPLSWYLQIFANSLSSPRSILPAGDSGSITESSTKTTPDSGSSVRLPRAAVRARGRGRGGRVQRMMLSSSSESGKSLCSSIR